ncbi:polysaccharide deacetylase family protein [Pseudochrobactrum sp. HB0163]|uniref:polysaccharide deacetylase family protein n=1 Tax=Pseudochrobactrum sp. HB0163 TaxID=3450708 RepID=UPI003F6E20E0
MTSSVPILIYHSVDVPPSRDKPFRSLHVHPEDFRRQMKWLKRLGYQGLSMRDARPYLEGKKQGKIAVITFDDGFYNVYHHALPVLREFGFTATNYFVANQIGGRNEWDIPHGAVEIPCMTAEQLRDWAANGHEVGAHTLDHIYLPDATKQEAERQIAGSKTRLEEILGTEILNFCYPYGGENAQIREIVREAGYQYATTTKRGRARTGDDPFGLPRRFIRRTDNGLLFLKKLLAR